MSKETISVILLGVIVFMFVVLSILTIVFIVSSGKKAKASDETEEKAMKRKSDGADNKKNTSKNIESKENSKDKASLSKRSASTKSSQPKASVKDDKESDVKIADVKRADNKKTDNKKTVNRAGEQEKVNVDLLGDTKEIDTKKVRKSTVANTLAKRQAAAANNIEPTLAKKEKVELDKDLLADDVLLENIDSEEAVELSAKDSHIEDRTTKVIIGKADAVEEADEEADEDTDELIGEKEAADNENENESKAEEVKKSEKTAPRIVSHNTLSFEKERLTTSISGYNIREKLGFEHKEELGAETAETAENGTLETDNKTTETEKTEATKNTEATEAAEETKNVEVAENAETAEAAKVTENTEVAKNVEVAENAEAAEAAKVTENTEVAENVEVAKNIEVAENTMSAKEIAETLANQLDGVAAETILPDVDSAFADNMEENALFDKKINALVKETTNTKKSNRKRSVNTVSSTEQFYWFNKDDVAARPNYKTPEMYYHKFDTANDCIEDLLVEMYDCALVRTEEIRYIAYGIVPQSYSIKEIMSGRTKAASQNKLKEPTRADLVNIYEKWCGYVDKLFDIVEIHADEYTLDEIYRSLCEFGQSDIDVLLEGM